MSPREYAKANRHIGEAWEDGKTVQFRRVGMGKDWHDYEDRERPIFLAQEYEWRIKPEPPQPKFRAWKPEEVPVGAVIRPRNERGHSWIISGYSINNGTIAIGQASERTVNEFLTRDYEYKWPHEDDTKWRPCGVEVKE